MGLTVAIRSKIEINGVNPFVRVSAKNVTRLKPDWRRPLPVLIRVNGQPNPAWRINLMPIGDGSFYLYRHGDVRKASDTQVGDLVDVQIKLDHEYKCGPAPVMPVWFAAALRRNAAANRGWKRLTPSRQKEIARYLSGLKSEAAQQRNLQKALGMLVDD